MKKIVEWLKVDYGYKIGLFCGAGVLAIAVYASFASTPVKKEAQAPAPLLTEEIMLDSMVRAWTDPIAQRFKKVCHDGSVKNNKEGFFILYGPKNPGDNENVLDEGWWYVEQEFFRTSAGKFYTNDIPSLDKTMHVYPDVTGLVCKDR